eukprot:7130624-Prymnesium_polylepis.1
MLGPHLLISPVTSEGARTVTARLPHEPTSERPTLWYDTVSGGAPLKGGGAARTVAAPLHVTPVFQRGGSIVPRRERVRRSALLGAWDPITLHVAPDGARAANGSLFLDDGHSFEYAGRGAAHALLGYAYRCASARACELTSSPQPYLGTSAFTLPRAVVVEQ